jgi:hypothetical protein
VQVVRLAVHFLKATPEFGANFGENGLEKFSNPSRDGLAAILGYKDQMIIEAIDDGSSPKDARIHIH